jgi:GT2 family glycosyltransferase
MGNSQLKFTRMNPELSIIIVNYNTRDLLRACLTSIYDQSSTYPIEIIVVDNASSDGSADMVHTCFPEVILVQSQKNVGFGMANNIGVSRSKAQYLVLLNSDTILLEDTPGALIDFLKSRPRAGAVGPNVFLPDGQRQPKICGDLPALGKIVNDSLLLSALFPRSKQFRGLNLESPDSYRTEVGWISGVCMAMPKRAYDQVGGFDARYFLYAEDMDLCRRLKSAGWAVFHLNRHGIVHHCGASSKTEAQRLRNALLQQRHFVTLMTQSMPPAQSIAAKLVLGAGLGIRIVIGVLAHAAGRAESAFLLRSSFLRLRDLAGLQWPPPVGVPRGNPTGGHHFSSKEVKGNGFANRN